MKLAIAKLPEFWRGITRNRDIERSAREWMDGYDAALAYCAEQLDQALSHAAGQDGEQCRAGAELDPSELSSLKQRAAAWDAVAATCREIDPDALAVYGPTGRESVVAFIRALSRGVPEGK